MPSDKYSSFSQLAENNLEEKDYTIHAVLRHSMVAIIAPHGGLIEPMTAEIATEIAGEDLRLYCFCANKPGLHITSTNFDEPRCAELIAACDQIVAIHGLKGNREQVDVGGARHVLEKQIIRVFAASRFQFHCCDRRRSRSYLPEKHLQSRAPRNGNPTGDNKGVARSP